MSTTKNPLFDELLNDRILDIIQDQIKTKLNEIKKQVHIEFDDTIDKIAAEVAIKVATYVSVERFGEDIRITIKKEN